MAEDLKPTLRALAAAVACLLLIACANVANLLLSKAAGRRQEMAIRAAVGAGRMRIVRQLLTESVVLAGAGALLGVAVADVLARYIARHAEGWPEGVQVELNWPVLASLAGIALAAAVLFGLAPALMARRSAAEGLRLRRDSGHTRLRSALAAGQVTLAFLLLAGGGLTLQSLRNLLHVDTGFDGSHVLTLEYRLPRNKYPQPLQQTRFHNEVVARVGALAGVEAAGIVRGLPFSGNGGTVTLGFPDRPAAPPDAPFMALYNAATPGYFETVRIPLREGRTFRDADNAGAQRVVVVSESFVRRFWPGIDAVGRQVLIPNRDLPPGKADMLPATVVGIVGNTRHDSLDEHEAPQLYVPYAQDPFIFATLVVRTRGNPLHHARDVQRAVWSIDREQPMWKIRTLQSLVDNSLDGQRVLLTLLGGFSAVALFLASLGLYAVMSYQVARRTAEFGVRMAMGAAPRDILQMVLREGLWLAATGLAAGLLMAPLFLRLLKAELFQVRTSDPLVYGLLGVLLLAASALAVALPAARATRLDAVQALRTE
jgi:putative ABC transport system permease protein